MHFINSIYLLLSLTELCVYVLYCNAPLNGHDDQIYGAERNAVLPDVPRRLALSNFEHLVSLSSEHRQTDRQLKTLYGSLSKL